MSFQGHNAARRGRVGKKLAIHAQPGDKALPGLHSPVLNELNR